MPCLGIEPTIFHCTVQYSTNWATPARPLYYSKSQSDLTVLWMCMFLEIKDEREAIAMILYPS